ncbi:MAG: tRNA (uridine(54)-C5)-methyltransferase TrmA [Cobetia sp.]|uniref:tRNA/tmRNA (uracil-C(5))-methyltransferase n=1 Tax=Cobetia amphilecti TaxID=1055104 RepID=A0ABT6URQ8_9GAMM|nr:MULTISPECIES: tRNA (uridine(54)-C5)-methyltransferase TrmA [Cobetia]MCK8069569.1 tRNA (uridine(54)-C5)-methyltransferase TrmA [Cobetia sp. 1CM21F]MCO7231449.1 tRNA (uridine(54)-C5)-methyltransferase TrmA [Cobetia sp. Dlab-2-AX]MCO7234142.1 tRNA (uridine(54)-C5)-methyltransferase TrmA [Cobetia sp. Dlab-2-U]MBK10121.1 tRNA (uridine(54)-C5)-methyltransferase TrmA [Cobetia sp.]MDH2298563.1 tRNA (uridine(54)-C5)-methyltransferase TrmA [Cobetia sp. 29-18-1]
MAIAVVDPSQYEQQLAEKAEQTRARFAAFDAPELEVFPSPPSHYRMRCEFRIWHEDDDLYYAMFEVEFDDEGNKKKTVVRMDDFPVASQRINELMPLLRERLKASPVLRERLFQCEFLTTLSGEALVTLIYHRKLGEDWEAEARALEEELDIMIIGRSRKQHIVLTRDHVFERLEVDGREYVYQQVENSFTQPNAEICRSMLSWARDVTHPDKAQAEGREQGDLVELYCGNGNFTIALAENFRRVLATEISRTSVASAQVNLAANSIDNAQVARMSAEDFSLALAGEKAGRRVAEMDLDNHDFRTVLVDPPRAGLDADSCEQTARYERIVYISCNPQTLIDNLEVLCRTHRIERFALFDQFPYTDHLECGVYLVRR